MQGDGAGWGGTCCHKTILSKVFPGFQNTQFLPVKTDIGPFIKDQVMNAYSLKGEREYVALK